MTLALVAITGALGRARPARNARLRVRALVQGRSRAEKADAGAPDRVRRLLRELDIEAPPVLVWRAWCASLCAAAVVGLLGGGAFVALLSMATFVGLTIAAVFACRGRRAMHLDNELPAALDALGTSLRSGASMSQAIDEARASVRGPLRDELDVVVRSIENGESLAQALDAWRDACPSGPVRMTIAAILLAAEAGGTQARTVDGVASTLRARLAVKRELTALTAQARLSALVIAAAPIVFTLLTGFGEAGSVEFLLRSPAGLACLSVGGLLDAVGGWWMLAITRRAA